MSRKPHINEAQVQDIRRLADEGLDAIEIAQRSGLSITTVRRHAKANRIQIARRAARTSLEDAA
jgi:DNA-binding NarL/FixJ family response regulator